MTTLFVSDVHLDSRLEKTTCAFSNWLAGPARDAERVFILGDLFEAWIGDDDDDPYKLERLAEIKALAETNTDVSFMHGNRDFLAGKQFAQSAGLTLLPDPCEIEVNGERWLLSHGDAWCTDDTEYQAFRQQVRNPAWQQAVLTRPLEERRALASQMRDASSEAGATKSAEIMDVNTDAVAASYAAADVATIVHGHTHRPACHRVVLNKTNATRWVLGDWFRQQSWLEVSGSRIKLHSLPLN